MQQNDTHIILSKIFGFFKDNIKELFSIVFRISLPLLLVYSVTSVIFYEKIKLLPISDYTIISNFVQSESLFLLLYIVINISTVILMMSVVFSFMQLNKTGDVSSNNCLSQVKKKFFRLLLTYVIYAFASASIILLSTSIPVIGTILVFVSLFFILLMQLTFVYSYFENIPFIESVQQILKLERRSLFSAFTVIFLFLLVIVIAGRLLDLPERLFTLKENEVNFIFYFVSSIKVFVTTMFNVFIYVALVVIYDHVQGVKDNVATEEKPRVTVEDLRP